MAILDKSLELSDAQVITATAVSTNVIDFGATKSASIGRETGAGEQLYLQITVGATFTAAGAGTLTIALQDSADNSSFADVLTTPPLALASLAAGASVYIPFKPPMRRYVRANYTVATGPMLTGNVSAHVVDGANFIRSYPDGLPKVV